MESNRRGFKRKIDKTSLSNAPLETEREERVIIVLLSNPKQKIKEPKAKYLNTFNQLPLTKS